jgi:uncharacterized protein (TIGR02246 family)
VFPEIETGNPTTVREGIDGARGAFASAIRRGDARAAGEAYCVDSILVAPGAVLSGRPAIEAFWRTGLEAGVFDLEVEAIDVRLDGDAAVEVGRYALHVKPEEGAAIVDRGRYLIVLRVDDRGHWLRAAEMFSPDEPPWPR